MGRTGKTGKDQVSIQGIKMDEEHGYDKALRSYKETCERGWNCFGRKKENGIAKAD